MAALRRGAARRYADGTPDVSSQNLTGDALSLAMEQRAAARNAAGTPGTIADTLSDRAQLQRSPQAIAADFAQMFPERMPQVLEQQRIFQQQQAAGQPPGGSWLGAQGSAAPEPAAAPGGNGIGQVLQRGLQAVNPISSAEAATAGSAPAPTSAAPTGRSSLDTIGDMIMGRYSNVAADPQASPFSSWLARTYQGVQTVQRARDAASPPSAGAWLAHIFAGSQSDTGVPDRAAAAQALGHPLAQQRLINDPNELAAAEKDPVGYTQTPDFKAYMQNAQQTHAAASDPQGILHPGGFIKVPGDPVKVANVALTTNTTLPQALASTETPQYTRDEFIKAMRGVTFDQAKLLFGGQLEHVQTPQEALTKDYLGGVQNTRNQAAATIQRLQAEDQARSKNNQKPQNAAEILKQQGIIDQAALDIARTERAIIRATSPMPEMPQQ